MQNTIQIIALSAQFIQRNSLQYVQPNLMNLSMEMMSSYRTKMSAEFGQDEESQIFFIFHFLNIFILTFTLEKIYTNIY